MSDIELQMKQLQEKYYNLIDDIKYLANVSHWEDNHVAEWYRAQLKSVLQEHK